MLKRVFTYYLAISFAAGAIGVNLVGHTCHLFGVTEYAFSDIDPCCDFPEGEGEQLDINCCSIDHHSFAIDVETTVEADALDTDVSDMLTVAFETAETDGIRQSVSSSPQKNHSPPTLESSQRRNLIQVYRL